MCWCTNSRLTTIPVNLKQTTTRVSGRVVEAAIIYVLTYQQPSDNHTCQLKIHNKIISIVDNIFQRVYNSWLVLYRLHMSHRLQHSVPCPLKHWHGGQNVPALPPQANKSSHIVQYTGFPLFNHHQIRGYLLSFWMCVSLQFWDVNKYFQSESWSVNIW